MKSSFGFGVSNQCASLLLSHVDTHGAFFVCIYIRFILYYNAVVLLLLFVIATLTYLRFICIIIVLYYYRIICIVLLYYYCILIVLLLYYCQCMLIFIVIAMYFYLVCIAGLYCGV